MSPHYQTMGRNANVTLPYYRNETVRMDTSFPRLGEDGEHT